MHTKLAPVNAARFHGETALFPKHVDAAETVRLDDPKIRPTIFSFMRLLGAGGDQVVRAN